MEKYHCQRCGHEWLPRVEKPVECPKCKSPYWNKPRGGKDEESREGTMS